MAVVIREQARGTFNANTLMRAAARRGILMKGILVAGAALLTIAVSPAHAVTYSWQGDLFVTAIAEDAAGNCATVNQRVGNFGRGIYRPRALGDNGSRDQLTLHYPNAAFHVLVTNMQKLNGATAGTLSTMFGSGGFNSVTNSTISNSTTNPVNPAIGTPTVIITTTIHNVFSGGNPVVLSGCHITLSGTLAKKP
jgi:hypothetical protein